MAIHYTSTGITGAPTVSGVTTYTSSIILAPGTAPTATEGAVYYDSTKNALLFSDGTAFNEVSASQASGGVINEYTSGIVTYRVHTFRGSGIFTHSGSGNLEALCVAGGGGVVAGVESPFSPCGLVPPALLAVSQ